MVLLIFTLDFLLVFFQRRLLTIYEPTIYTALCIMFWMSAYPIQGELGGDWALEYLSFLGPVKWHQANRQVPFGAQKSREF